MTLPYEDSLTGVKDSGKDWEDPSHEAKEEERRSTSRPSTRHSSAGGRSPTGQRGGSATSPRSVSFQPRNDQKQQRPTSSTSTNLAVSPQQQQQPQRNDHSSTSPASRASSARGSPRGHQPTRLLIPLRKGPVKVPPAPFAPPPPDKKKSKPTICPESAKMAPKPKFLQGLEQIAEAGSARRERVEEQRKQRAKSTASQSAAQWQLCKHEQGFFADTFQEGDTVGGGSGAGTSGRRASTSPGPKKLVMDEAEREKVVERLYRLKPPPKPLPPLAPRLVFTEEEEEELVERLAEPFERPEPEEPERHILDDEELDEMIQRLYQAPLDKKAELREARGW